MGLINKLFPFIMKNKRNLFTKLIVQGTGYSTRAVLVLAAVILGGLLLAMLMASMIVDLYFNHTLTISLGDAALFITSVTSLWTAAGLSKALGNRKEENINSFEETEINIDEE